MKKQSVQQALERKGLQIATAAEIAAREIHDWQTIQAYITGKLQSLELTPGQQSMLGRYQFIYNQLVSIKYTEQDVKEMVQTAYRVSDVQALKDIRAAKELFATTLNINKLFELKIALEWNKQMMQKADEMNDLKAYAALEKNRAKLLSMLPEDESHLADMFTPHVNEFVFDPTLLGVTPPSKKEIDKLLSDIENRYGGKIVLKTEIEDAEIITDES